MSDEHKFVITVLIDGMSDHRETYRTLSAASAAVSRWISDGGWIDNTRIPARRVLAVERSEKW